jgi:hypothetical protein
LATACTGDGPTDASAGEEVHLASPAPSEGADAEQDPVAGSTTEAPEPPAAAGPFFEDFSGGGSLARFEFDIFHRDDVLGTQKTDWPGDHPSTGPNDLCGPPEEKRTVHRGQRSQGFNNEWIYRCVPGGDTNKAHLMTSIGDTSGYSIGAFTPTQTFTNVREVRWDINITDLGNRQFPEIKIMPTDTFDFQNMPCTIEWFPCDTTTHGELGSVGTSFFNHQLTINNGTNITESDSWDRPWMHEGDPALTSIRTRRHHFFRDNGDNTLTFGIEQPDGTFYELTGPGSFPTGDVRVVFADHNYTPTKDDAPSFTWHWDNITILRAEDQANRTDEAGAVDDASGTDSPVLTVAEG